MAQPKVFVSSTFYDLKHIRSSLETFIRSLGFEPVLFEKGAIPFDPGVALDESCYRDAGSADIFVLIVGGRYGSKSSDRSELDAEPVLAGSYVSITRREFETAQKSGVPTFILVESSVAAEYLTYRRNANNTGIEYAHVDSPQVFELLQSIYSLHRNNPVFEFRSSADIEAWLRSQWAGLFRELLRAQTEGRQLSTLSAEVAELKSANQTLKVYVENLLAKVNPDNFEDIIMTQDSRQKMLRDVRKYLTDTDMLKDLIMMGYDEEDVLNFIQKPQTVDEAIEASHELVTNKGWHASGSTLLSETGSAEYNTARKMLGLSELKTPDHLIYRGGE